VDDLPRNRWTNWTGICNSAAKTVTLGRNAEGNTETGKYEASVYAIDANCAEAEAKIEITVQWLPVLVIEPEEFDEVVLAGEEKQTIMSIGNRGAGPMDFEISVAPGVSASPEWTGSIAPEFTEHEESIVKVHPISGHLAPGESQDIIITLGSQDAACVTYLRCLHVSANDPHRPFAAIPVTLKINSPPSIALTRTVIAAPNPASERVTFYYDIDTDGEILVYDVASRPVHVARLSAAAKSYEWDLTKGGRPVANGLYLYIVFTDTGERSEMAKLVVGGP
jgi:uncharacterized membrane protein